MANDENDNNAAQVYLLGKTYLANNQGQFFIRNDPIVQMAAGDRHTIIVTETGRAFAFGDNSSGQLGLGHTSNVEKVSCIKSLKFGETGERVILAACGRESSLVATNRGAIYAFGSNSRSQLGIESSDATAIHSQPSKIEHFKGRITWKQLSMGAEHACALTDDGELYVWGANDDGQCGQPRKHDTIKTPQQFRVEHRVKAISCGYYHTAFVTDDGRLFVYGNNDDRQLGRSVKDQFAGPVEVSLPDKAQAVACGNQHTVVLTEKGEVYTCGHGDRGQLGLGSRVTSAETFEHVQGLPKRITAIAVGEAHTSVIGPRGDIYVFGDGKHGKLGIETHTNEFEPCSIEKFKTYNALKVVCGGCQTIVLAEKKSSDRKRSSGSDEEIGNTTLSITQRPKSRARDMRSKTLTDRSLTVGDSMDATRQHTTPLRTSNHLRVEADDEDQSDKELSASLKSATFNQTHTISKGRFRPTQTPSLDRTSLRPNDDELRPLKTGALDRTVRLNKETDDLTKTMGRLPALGKSPGRDTQFDRSSTPTSPRKKPDYADDKSPVRNTRHDQSSPPSSRKKLDDDDDRLPIRNTRQDRSSPTLPKKKLESDEDRVLPRNTRFDRSDSPLTRKKPEFDDDKSSEEEQPSKSVTKKSDRLSPVVRNDRRPSPVTRRKDDSESDDNRYKRSSPPTKTPMSERLDRKTRQTIDSEKEESESADDDDEEDKPRVSSRQPKQQPPPTAARRSSLPPQTRSGGPATSPRDGNQTIGSKPADTVRGSFRSQATKTLAKPTANNDTTQKDVQPAQQPGFFSRLFGPKSTPPPPPPPPPPAATPANANSRTCSVM